MKQKKIWSFDTASKVAAAKSAKYGETFVVVQAQGGGFNVKTVAEVTAVPGHGVELATGRTFATYNE